MRVKRKGHVLFLLLLLAASLVLLWSGSVGVVTDAVDRREKAAAATGAADRVELSFVATPRTRLPHVEPPLPLLDAPLAEVLTELEDRARRGDAQAACRLAMDGSLCRELERTRGAVDFFVDAAARQDATSPGDIDALLLIESREARAAATCAGISESWADDNTWRYMLQAALAGHHGLAARFAAAPPMDTQRFLEQPDRWQAYATHAPGLLQRAAEAGDPRAVYVFQRVLAGQHPLRGMPNAIAPDPRAAAMLALALYPISDPNTRRNLDQAIERARALLDDEHWRALQADAEAFISRHFAEQPVIDFDSGVFGEMDASMCEAG